MKIGRNDPCPCGSGKKHKICCIESRDAALPTFVKEVRERAFGMLCEFAARDEFLPLRDAMLDLFFGPEFFDLPDTQKQQILQNEDCMGNFLYWFLFEASIEGHSRTLASRLLSRKAHILPLPDRRYLEAMRNSHLRLYEVETIQLDKGMRLRDCWDGTEYDVRERLATHQLAKHSVVALRLRPEPNGEYVIDGPGFAAFTHADKNAILSDLRAEYQAVLETDGNEDNRFSFYHGAVIAQHVVYGMLFRPAPQLATSTGEPVVFCKVIFDLKDRDLAREVLERIKELTLDNDDDSYVWIRGKNRILHASVRFESGCLVAETHSIKRAGAVRKLLERYLGEVVRYRGTEEQDARSALAEYRGQPVQQPKQEPPMPADVEEMLAEYEDRHYRLWIDTPLPALANKTPRQAVRFRALRGALVGLLKDFTAAAELQRRIKPRSYDFSWMWGELGINPNDPMNMRISRTNADRTGKTANRDGKGALAYRLKVTLQGSKPPIWRRVSLSGKEPLDRVHMILNCAIGWTDTHLHAFEIEGTRYSVPDPETRNDDKDERKMRLADLPLTIGSSFIYWYDFGDGWEHRVVVESIEPADAAAKLPACEAGRRACPPEDIGGIYGYLDFLKSPERWPEYGPAGFDPDAFDANEINEALRDLPKKWQPVW